ncbi:methylglyoxal synthase [Desertifilum sp. FACHB-1129]|uniref:Methylglyoxal synthase n=2 Tax=Cyanophyceae TaxID=3028117 RepID=A0A1E5QCW2_9CYAN|nr:MULTISPECIES: methylglyoxal synthase [Cyanophyceae]MDA0211656.1 methylglyoxal synthase [Cyanobacteria bacterium FC1]MBD2312163.1 methylglyoxal synthase [Desertifilum sp. FACHB-1129]MBD2322175.1 methylglyoxal synthase [Desertifilum sp. FACHB-866]MBD2332212.1 methylglyoxal synthase [Desertifilum sp. FACHB-868]MDL5056322.1 methylglyoxal synthase [Geitlerinema calcuttense NRMC-F 0142]
MANTIALIAHDSKKDEIVDFVKAHAPLLGRYLLIATGTTGERLQAETGLKIERLLSGPLGGDAQIAARVAVGEVAAVIFLVDPLYAQPHEPDIQALLRICNVHNVPLATNLATAEAIATRLAKTLVAHLIFNPVSGQGNSTEDLNLIRQLLEPHLDLFIHQTTPNTEPQDLAKQALAADADLVIASGGDGTVSAVAGALIGTGVPLGIIPRGTANAFAITLGLPRFMPIRNACQTILGGHTRTIDAAQCNGMPMVLLAGMGYEAVAVELANREFKDQWGAFGYFVAGWQAIDEGELFDTEISLGGDVYDFQAHAITIANAAPPTSVLAQGAGEVIFDDGLLDVTIATAQTKLQGVTTMLKMFGAALTRTNVEQQNVVHFRAKHIKVTATPPQKVVVDGEVIGTTAMEVECIPRGLTVVVPQAQRPDANKPLET